MERRADRSRLRFQKRTREKGGMKMQAKKRKVMVLATICISVLLVASTAYTIGALEDGKISGKRLHAVMKDLCAIAGTGIDSGRRMNEAGEKAAMYVFNKFKDVGLQNVRLEPVETTRWWPTDWEVTVLDPSGEETLLSFPWWYSNGIESVEAELVYVGYGTPGEFGASNVKDKIVLVDMKRFLHFIPSTTYTGAYMRAVTKGARAVINSRCISRLSVWTIYRISCDVCSYTSLFHREERRRIPQNPSGIRLCSSSR